MSRIRKNWSALSSLARQWTMEDDEEVEREKRRRVKSVADPDDPDADNPDRAPGDTPTSDSTRGADSTSETSQGLSSVEQIQLDFVEMLRVRDEKRRNRHVETLRRQKEVGEDGAEDDKEGARVEILGDLDEGQSSAPPLVKTKPASYNPSSSSSSSSSSTSTSTNSTNRPHENEESSGRDPDPKPQSNPARKFVSSVSISLDKSPSASGPTTPVSPRSPTAPMSPRGHCPSPCQSPLPRGARSPIQSGHTEETSVNGTSPFEQSTKTAFVRQSPRTISFQMRKKEQESAPLQRSASVRVASKKFESNTDQNEDEEKASSFQRNSRQRISSRSIQEKMERLAHAAQKTEATRSPDVTRRTLSLMEEVSRKRGLFEQQPADTTSPGVSRQEFRSFTSGMSDRINRWLNKTNQTGSSQTPTDLRHVDINSKRSLFESRGEDRVAK